VADAEPETEGDTLDDGVAEGVADHDGRGAAGEGCATAAVKFVGAMLGCTQMPGTYAVLGAGQSSAPATVATDSHSQLATVSLVAF
jgi:hypothetical protein